MPSPFTYDKYFVAFIDVLGFKNLVMGNRPHDKQRIQTFFEMIKYFRKEWKQIEEKREIKVVSVSDSIFLACEAQGNQTADLNSLAHLCVAVGNLQIGLCTNNVWCRGAISCGDTYLELDNENPENGFQATMFGPAIVNAVELEKANAKYPRIILDTKILDFLGIESSSSLISKLNKISKEANWTNWRSDLLLHWHDGRYELNFFKKDYPLFIDYIGEIFHREDNLPITIAENLRRIAKESPNAYEKFRWVGDYMKMRRIGTKYNDPNLVQLLSDY